MTFKLASRAALFAAVALFAACGKPNYPECKVDDDCKEHQQVCIEGFCKECRDDKQCKEGFVCGKDHACAPKPQCGKKEDCPSGQKCSPDQKCVAECTAETAAKDCAAGQRCLANGACGGPDDCSGEGDCGDGKACINGKCGVKSISCNGDDECPDGSACVGSVCKQGAARKVKGPACEMQAVHFDFDQATIKKSERAALDSDVQCIQKLGAKKLLVEGHTDERGTTEYNLALGNRRAAAVKKFLKHAAPGVRVETQSLGKEKPIDEGHDEGAWGKNRRAEMKAE